MSTDSIIRYDGYKLFAGFKYPLDFPDSWIMNELPDTGRECSNCVGRENKRCGYAMWRGIVIGYCGNCSQDYHGERGKGFYSNGVEIVGRHGISAFDTYLKGIDLDTFGDIQENPLDTMETHYEVKNSFMEIQEEDYGEEEEEEKSTDVCKMCGEYNFRCSPNYCEDCEYYMKNDKHGRYSRFLN